MNMSGRSGSLSGERDDRLFVLPASTTRLAIPRRKLAHVIGVGPVLPRGVLSAPVGEVIKEASDLVKRPVESAYEEIAGMTDAPAAQIGGMVVVLLEQRHAPAQRARLIRLFRNETLFALL